MPFQPNHVPSLREELSTLSDDAMLVYRSGCAAEVSVRWPAASVAFVSGIDATQLFPVPEIRHTTMKMSSYLKVEQALGDTE